MTKTKFEVMDICNKVDIPVGPILSMKEIAEEQSLRKTGTVVEVDHPTRGKYLTVGNPIKLSDSISEVKRSPLLGEHTDEILTNVLGFKAAEIAEIKNSGAIERAGEGRESGVTVVPLRARRARRWIRPRPANDRKDWGGCCMRIVVHGQQAFGKAVLEALLKRGENVVAVYVAPEKEGAKADPLKEAALAAKLPVYQPASYKTPEVLGGVQGAQARSAGDGLRHAVRAGGIPQRRRRTARSSITPRCCRPIAAPPPSTGRSSRARRKPACRSSGPTTASIPATC